MPPVVREAQSAEADKTRRPIHKVPARQAVVDVVVHETLGREEEALAAMRGGTDARAAQSSTDEPVP
jgi:hypothetical protein